MTLTWAATIKDPNLKVFVAKDAGHELDIRYIKAGGEELLISVDTSQGESWIALNMEAGRALYEFLDLVYGGPRK